ncbi:MAG: DISARM system phospholipase D-like protein DrmC [Labilithrix sp.]|nr:DISARM system phospholipase D-like protein DrmC [Labilithrix sp.]MCW5816999.1 DISARM system phospholipase D-like protein DrmC [Labilithrix sp.]
MKVADLSTADLVKLCDLVRAGALSCPLTETPLRAHGFGAFAASIAASLAFESRAGLLLALDLLIEERTRAERPPLELVWTGPDTTSPQTRDTAVVLAELCRRARRRVLVAGYVFAQGESVLRPLHDALVRGLDVRLFLHVPEGAASEVDVPAHAARWVREFVRRNWPFGEPLPVFFHDPRTSRRDGKVLLHAKCAVADGRHALVTSANYTSFGQTRHIEVGVLIDDVGFAGRLEGQFNGLVSQGLLQEVALTA